MTEEEARRAQTEYREKTGKVAKAIREIMGLTPFAVVLMIDPHDMEQGTLSFGNVPPELQKFLLYNALESFVTDNASVTIGQLFSTKSGEPIGGADLIDKDGIVTKNKA